MHVNGADLNVSVQGTGRPIVLLHGVWMSSRFFEPQVRALSTRLQVVSVDFRAHGRSEAVQVGHTMGSYARDVREIVQQLRLEKPVLLGWSMGAFVMWEYLRRYSSEDLAATIVVDESPSDFKWPDWPHGQLDAGELRAYLAAVQTDRRAFLEEFVSELFHTDDGDLRTMALEEMQIPPEAVASTILFDQTVQDYRDVLPDITAPTLICHGRHDALVPQAAGRYVAERVPGAELQIFDRSAHCPFLEEPDAFNAAILAFIDRLA